MGINEIQNMKGFELFLSSGKGKAESTERCNSFSKILGEKQLKCPYSHLAKDGLIEYNGVTFVCDYRTNSICLGDVSNPKNVLNISLPSGGNLKVNVDNFGDLSRAAGMFSPADLNAIMRAIAQYNHCTKKLNELDEEEIETVENITNKANEQTKAIESASDKDKADLSGAIKEFEDAHKLSAQELKDEEDWRSMSDDDWDKLLSGVDKYIDAYKEDIRERVKKQMEAAQKAALEADPEMRSKAAQEAALSVAASGFDAGEGSEGEETAETTGDDPGIDHEKNWTRKLKTDDQTVLRAAKAAQAMENMALSRMEEIASAGVSAYESYSGMVSRYMRDRRFMNYA